MLERTIAQNIVKQVSYPHEVRRSLLVSADRDLVVEDISDLKV